MTCKALAGDEPGPGSVWEPGPEVLGWNGAPQGRVEGLTLPRGGWAETLGSISALRALTITSNFLSAGRAKFEATASGSAQLSGVLC